MTMIIIINAVIVIINSVMMISTTSGGSSSHQRSVCLFIVTIFIRSSYVCFVNNAGFIFLVHLFNQNLRKQNIFLYVLVVTTLSEVKFLHLPVRIADVVWRFS